jgi:hypothetical protein
MSSGNAKDCEEFIDVTQAVLNEKIKTRSAL